MQRPLTALSVALSGDEPPSEFRIFAAGANETVKGTFIFDSAAATSVMAEYEAHGIDLAIDYNHAMLEAGVDPALAGKAAGWFQLAVRAGELWAVNVRWTEPAAAALRAKEWRFISPAFTADKSGRVLSVLNVAITNLPATRRLQPLMAASIGACGMNQEQIQKALDALISGDTEAASEILKEMIASAASGGSEAPMAPLEEMTETPTPEEEEEMSSTPEEEKTMAVAASRITRLTGKKTLAESLDDIATWRASHVALETERQKMARERATLESAERRKLCQELVALGAEFPHTIWSDDTSTTVKPRWAKMSIDDLRTHVSEQRNARRGKPAGKGAPIPADGTAADGSRVIQTSRGPVTVSANQIKECELSGAKLEVFAENLARRTGGKK